MNLFRAHVILTFFQGKYETSDIFLQCRKINEVTIFKVVKRFFTLTCFRATFRTMLQYSVNSICLQRQQRKANGVTLDVKSQV